MSAFDWGALLRAGIREGGLRPAEFWALSPAELMLVLGRDGAALPMMTRDRLDDLIARWPDQPLGTGDQE